MNHVQTGYFNHDFRTCLSQLMEHGLEAHPRGTTTKELLNYNITLLKPRNRVILFPERKINLKYLLGEFIWYLSGSIDPADITPYSKFWTNITNTGTAEGYTEGTLNSNYGTRLFGLSNLPTFQSINQWQETIKLLKRDKDSRQAVLNIHVPTDRHEGNRDVACTLALQFLIREDELHLIVTMRSNDVVLGTSNDVFQFTMLQEVMQLKLKQAYPDLKLGHYFHNTGSMHIYDRHFLMAEAIIANKKAIDIEMAPMDEFNEVIKWGLIDCERTWRTTGMSPEFEFSTLNSWKVLTPYWRNLLKGMFLEDDEALHAIFQAGTDNEKD